jgi:molecular chaperone GrpE
MRRTMLDALAKHGLERIDPAGSEDGPEPFDPTLHEAVVHAEGESGQAGPVVAEVMRAGYVWKGRVVRPAMVSVRG